MSRITATKVAPFRPQSPYYAGKGHNGAMSISVEGLYRNGKVELLEPVAEADGSRVIVTWPPRAGIDEAHALDLRRRLAAFAEDWNRPEMSVYDELPEG